MTVLLGLWLVRLLVAAVFGWAGVAKLLDRAGTRRAVAEFGVPDRWVRVVAWALPVVELGVAIAVLLPWTVVAGGLVAFGLLLAFSVVVAWLLRKGERPACACFGGGSAAIGGRTLARNAVLGLLVLVAVVGARDGLPGEYAVASAVAVGLATVQLWQGRELRGLRRLVADPPAEEAPVFDLPDTAGGRGGLYTALAAGVPVVLVFLSVGCVPCARIAAELPRWRERLAGKATILAICSGEPAAVAEWAREHAAGEMLVERGDEVSSGYGLRGTPSAVLVDATGRVAAPVAGGTFAIRELLGGGHFGGDL